MDDMDRFGLAFRCRIVISTGLEEPFLKKKAGKRVTYYQNYSQKKLSLIWIKFDRIGLLKVSFTVSVKMVVVVQEGGLSIGCLPLNSIKSRKIEKNFGKHIYVSARIDDDDDDGELSSNLFLVLWCFLFFAFLLLEGRGRGKEKKNGQKSSIV